MVYMGLSLFIIRRANVYLIVCVLTCITLHSFNFVQFLGNFGKFVCWRPPGELAPPPRGNPGSATDNGLQ